MGASHRPVLYLVWQPSCTQVVCSRYIKSRQQWRRQNFAPGKARARGARVPKFVVTKSSRSESHLAFRSAKFACIRKLQGARAPVPHAWRPHCTSVVLAISVWSIKANENLVQSASPKMARSLRRNLFLNLSVKWYTLSPCKSLKFGALLTQAEAKTRPLSTTVGLRL